MKEYLDYLKAKHLDFTGKKILLTGGNSGIGEWTFYYLASLGGEVTIASRNASKGNQKVLEIKEKTNNQKLQYLPLDQSNKDSVNSFLEMVKNEHFDIIILNAGIYFPKKDAAKVDGMPLTLATNLLGTFRLLEGLSKLFPNGRYVLTTSLAAEQPKDHDYDAYFKKEYSSRQMDYFVSKAGLNSLFFHYLKQGLDIVLFHPGVTKSNIIREYATIIKKIGNGVVYLFTHSPSKACLGQVMACSNEVKKGSYIVPDGLFHISGYPKVIEPPLKYEKDAEVLYRVLSLKTKN